jgi:hypothetical protein
VELFITDRCRPFDQNYLRVGITIESLKGAEHVVPANFLEAMGRLSAAQVEELRKVREIRDGILLWRSDVQYARSAEARAHLKNTIARVVDFVDSYGHVRVIEDDRSRPDHLTRQAVSATEDVALAYALAFQAARAIETERTLSRRTILGAMAATTVVGASHIGFDIAGALWTPEGERERISGSVVKIEDFRRLDA